MTKIKEMIGLAVVLMVLAVSLPALARSHGASPYGPEAKRLGAGLYLGDPTGIAFKGYLTDKFAVNGVAGWEFRDKALTVIGDVTYDFLDIPIDSHVVTLPFYAGAGAKLEINAGPGDDTVVGLRVPVGVAVQWVQYPIEIFVEVAPGIEVAPSSELDLTGGIGGRFYF